MGDILVAGRRTLVDPEPATFPPPVLMGLVSAPFAFLKTLFVVWLYHPDFMVLASLDLGSTACRANRRAQVDALLSSDQFSVRMVVKQTGQAQLPAPQRTGPEENRVMLAIRVEHLKAVLRSLSRLNHI